MKFSICAHETHVPECPPSLTQKGETALHIATRFGFADVVERLRVAQLASEGEGLGKEL